MSRVHFTEITPKSHQLLDAENKFVCERTYDLRNQRYSNYQCSFSFENEISVLVIVERKRLRFATHTRFWCSKDETWPNKNISRKNNNPIGDFFRVSLQCSK